MAGCAERERTAGELLAEFDIGQGEIVNGDFDGQGKAAGTLIGRFRRWERETIDGDSGGCQPLGMEFTGQEIERRPVELDAVELGVGAVPIGNRHRVQPQPAAQQAFRRRNGDRPILAGGKP